MTEKVDLDEIELEPDYRPSPDEPYMNPKQLAFFRRKLLDWRNQIVEDTTHTRQNMNESENQADEVDRASQETERYTELRTVEREQRLLSKIDAALRRIENGEFGYCEVTGEPIGVRRLEARPVATLSIEAKEAQERQERQMAED
ncbi:molecular chaperone DnaK [Thiohalorhabdus denitrificans]|uniref:RNA polymerase-binding transcription factor DksA n=1 Tax=Thiohalorhabdus denitrificans TaxID=381306 RepID=A0A0P9CQF2_9GAMM|nr:RNA polymerase-binding protein DksA [Thiohalorhabdus denitrificans]KPV41468.1 molecular chaperone DnaK [Thiohalorhabdus denitrificans]SCY28624.1 transcriptional regulator, TraR/DksA family [Thiohalorhabdus denitrificans]